MSKSKLQQKKDNPKSTYWRNRADKLWGAVIHAKYDRCAVESPCCKGNLEAHHLISRSNGATRHSIENGILLCSKHHKFDQLLSAHKAPLAFSEWFMTTYPERWEWHSKHKWAMGTVDYENAYNELVKWCEVNAPELLRG